jgi:hypothetical protein
MNFLTMPRRDVFGQYIEREPEKCFWYRVKKTPSCWLWIGTLTKSGYGQLGSTHRGKVFAHRLSWEMHYGEIPDGMNVLHKCDIRNCVRPLHLFLGDQVENNKDMWKKGRGKIPHYKGEKNPANRLKEKQVLLIRRWHKEKKYKLSEMGRLFSVHVSTIWLIVHRKKWTWL